MPKQERVDSIALPKLTKIVIEAKVIRGPESEYGPPGEVTDLGVIADSSTRWQLLGAWRAMWRTARANTKRGRR
jgi:hypothetical protein